MSDTNKEDCNDLTINPPHYKMNKECIEVLRESMSPVAFEGYLVGNIQKYLYRYKHKNGIEDLKKAEWYLKYLIKIQDE